MESDPTRICHVVAKPYPGRGHVNAMINLCKLLTSRNKDILVTLVVTEEWLGLLGSENKPNTIRFRSIPNVIPSETIRAFNLDGFIEAVATKMEAPFEQLLDRLEPPPSVLLIDTFITWAVGVGNRRNIPVASFWPMSTCVFSMFQHFHLITQNGHFPVDAFEKGDERVDYIPGISSTRLVDLPYLFRGNHPSALSRVLEAFSWLPKAQYLVLSSIYELESQTFDALRAEFSIPIYTIGPIIPYNFNALTTGLSPNSSIDIEDLNYYLKWLNNQPTGSVLYISFGSFLSVSSAQMDEIVAGLHSSGVRFMWVARGEAKRLMEDFSGDKGIIVPWCDQLKVLCHSSVGGFWTHCGWNSVKEGIVGGVPFLTFPITMDQPQNSTLIVEDWKIGWRAVSTEVREDNLVTREEISQLVKTFMDLECNEVREMRKRVKQLQQFCHEPIGKGGSSDTNIDAFIKDITWQSYQH